MTNRWLTLVLSIGLAGCGSVVVQGTPDDSGVEADAPPTDRPGLDVTDDRPASSNDVGRACTTPADCAGDQACVGAEGCGTPWTCQSVEGRVCNGDWSPMCGCDGQTFYGTWSCPDRPFARRGLCTMPPAPVDAGRPAPVDAGSPEPVDAGVAIDTGSTAPDAGEEPPVKDDAGLVGDEVAEEPTGSLEGGCSAAPARSSSGVPGGLGLAALALVVGVRRRRRE